MAARSMGYDVHILDPDADCSARPFASRCITAPWNDAVAAAELARGCDVVTLEIEQIPMATLEAVAAHAPLHPGANAVFTIQDRARQREWLAMQDFPQGEFRIANTEQECVAAIAALGASIVKSSHGGYDGRGQMRVPRGGDGMAAWKAIGAARSVVEQFLPIREELSVLVARGEIRSADYVGAICAAALDTSVNKLLLKVSSNTQYADGHLLFVRQSSVVAQPFDLSTLELSGDASPVAEKVEYSTDKSRGSFSNANNGFFAYQPAGNNPRKLWMVNRAGIKIKDVGVRAVYSSAQLSRDGTKVVFDSQEGEAGVGDIWLYDLTRDLSTRFTFDVASEWQPIWSPDGARIVYATDKTGSGDLFIKNANGTESAILLLKDLPPKSATDWSPDGRFLLYYLFSPTSKEDLWMLPMDSTKTPRPYLQTEFTETNARFAPDSRWVVYQSDESGSNEIYVRPFPTGNGKWQISTNGGEFPMWSRDGKEIFYHQPGGATMSVEVSGAGAALIVGAATKVFDIPRSVVLDATADGLQFLTAVMIGAQSSPPVTLITQWDRELKKK